MDVENVYNYIRLPSMSLLSFLAIKIFVWKCEFTENFVANISFCKVKIFALLTYLICNMKTYPRWDNQNLQRRQVVAFLSWSMISDHTSKLGPGDQLSGVQLSTFRGRIVGPRGPTVPGPTVRASTVWGSTAHLITTGSWQIGLQTIGSWTVGPHNQRNIV